MPRAWLPLLLAFVVAGCGPKLVVIGGQPLRNPPQTEISLSPSTTEILALEGSMQHLKGRTSACNYPGNISSLPVFANVKIDYEALKAAQPDLVVYDANLYSPNDIAKLEDTVGKNKTFQFHAETIDEFESELRSLGAIIGAPINMSKYIDKIDSERATAKSMAPAKAPKVAVMSGSLLAGTKGFLADAVRAVGGEPVGPDSDRFMPSDPESIAKADPDMIVLTADVGQFTTDKAKVNAEMVKVANAFAADPKYRSIKAVRTSQIYPMNADVILRQGNRVDELIFELSQRVQRWAKA